MELYKDILCKILASSHVEVTFKDAPIHMTEVVESISYQALKRIKEIIDDPTLTDCECYMKIEEIIHVYEVLGCRDGNRHDD